MNKIKKHAGYTFVRFLHRVLPSEWAAFVGGLIIRGRKS